MGLLDGVRRRRKERKRARTEADIHAGLDRAYADAETRDMVSGKDRLVIFSDHHKGARDGADDFQRSERSYNAALAYYDRLGYQLAELGDVEELWENSFEEVATSYPATLALAAAFHSDDTRYTRYTRFWGNHDLAWSDAEFFQERMGAYGYGGVTPIESLRLAIKDATGQLVVELFLVHGHQGTTDSDLHATRSRFFVKRVWRPVQGLLNRPWNTPSVDWDLRGEHAEQMERWAAKNRRVLIAGHTHMPVFFRGGKKPAVAPADVRSPATEPDPKRKEALLLARLEWAKAEKERLRRQPPIELGTPCYFNTGCCSFGDGDITGLEIRDDEIWLVRWPSMPQTEPLVLEHMKLTEVSELAVKAGS